MFLRIIVSSSRPRALFFELGYEARHRVPRSVLVHLFDPVLGADIAAGVSTCLVLSISSWATPSYISRALLVLVFAGATPPLVRVARVFSMSASVSSSSTAPGSIRCLACGASEEGLVLAISQLLARTPNPLFLSRARKP